MFVPDVRQETRWFNAERVHASGLQSLVTVPILYDSEPVGVLGLDSPRFTSDHPPVAADLARLRALAAHTAVAIRHARFAMHAWWQVSSRTVVVSAACWKSVGNFAMRSAIYVTPCATHERVRRSSAKAVPGTTFSRLLVRWEQGPPARASRPSIDARQRPTIRVLR